MASETDITNLALSHLGDLANVQSITPPDGSTQAEHAARFFPHVRDTLLEMHTWGFATTCSALALVVNTSSDWGYAYAKPNDLIRMIGLSEIGFGFDTLYRETLRDEIQANGRPAWMDIINTSFEIVGDVVQANQSGGVFVYTKRVTDPTKFSPLFIRVFSWMLASDLAGPVLKGKTGAEAAIHCMQMANTILAQAKTSDANQRGSGRPTHRAPWIAGR